MPSGSTHDRITLWTLPVISLVTAWLARTPAAVLAVGSAYLFSGLMFAGDLDTYSRQYQRWLWLRWLWLPYRKLFRHRSFWTHGPLIGTVVRIIYLGSWVLLFILSLMLLGFLANVWQWQPQHWFTRVWAWAETHKTHLLLVGGGLELGAMNHSISDWLSSLWKRGRKQRLKRLNALPASRTAAFSTQGIPKPRKRRTSPQILKSDR
ncbi:MAG: metal-binding protein [Synechococcaceae cyanobacterium SM2_3_1]|nr:metal-binding protein [Synechococcaceae cyanobacterium SM2_3_1]